MYWHPKYSRWYLFEHTSHSIHTCGSLPSYSSLQSSHLQISNAVFLTFFLNSFPLAFLYFFLLLAFLLLKLCIQLYHYQCLIFLQDCYNTHTKKTLITFHNEIINHHSFKQFFFSFKGQIQKPLTKFLSLSLSNKV